jgi:hypothetical protein
MNKEQQVYILSPVRKVTPEQSAIITAHVEKVKRDGDRVFNPIENAPQLDPTGYNIVMTELAALDQAAKDGGRVDILWNLGGTPSEGSRVDVGMALSLGLQLRLVHVFNLDNPTGPQKCFSLISGWGKEIVKEALEKIQKSGQVVIDWDIERVTEEQEWQRIKLGLALGCLAQNPNLKIQLGELRGEDPPDKKSYPKVIREIEKRQDN